MRFGRVRSKDPHVQGPATCCSLSPLLLPASSVSALSGGNPGVAPVLLTLQSHSRRALQNGDRSADDAGKCAPWCRDQCRGKSGLGAGRRGRYRVASGCNMSGGRAEGCGGNTWDLEGGKVREVRRMKV